MELLDWAACIRESLPLSMVEQCQILSHLSKSSLEDTKSLKYDIIDFATSDNILNRFLRCILAVMKDYVGVEAHSIL